MSVEKRKFPILIDISAIGDFFPKSKYFDHKVIQKIFEQAVEAQPGTFIFENKEYVVKESTSEVIDMCCRLFNMAGNNYPSYFAKNINNDFGENCLSLLIDLKIFTNQNGKRDPERLTLSRISAAYPIRSVIAMHDGFGTPRFKFDDIIDRKHVCIAHPHFASVAPNSFLNEHKLAYITYLFAVRLDKVINMKRAANPNYDEIWYRHKIILNSKVILINLTERYDFMDELNLSAEIIDGYVIKACDALKEIPEYNLNQIEKFKFDPYYRN